MESLMALCLSTSIIGMAILTSTSAPTGNSGTRVDVDPAPARVGDAVRLADASDAIGEIQGAVD
jgi:hypothetical protein